MENINKEYLDKLHVEILSVMDEIDRVCKKNSLRYYLVGGSLLGAIRHNGFIPWDDDLDIAMPRDDFEKLISLAKTELKSDFSLEWITTDSRYWHPFAKIFKKGTMFQESGASGICLTGIFVDIFPLDLSSEYGKTLEIRKQIIRRINAAIFAKNKNEWTLRRIPHRLFALFFNIRQLHKMMTHIMTSARKAGHTHFANFGSQYKLKKQTMPVEWYGEGITVRFENRCYTAPLQYTKVLTSIYGLNYMDLPPEHKRRCHYPEKVLFSDGTVMEFEKPQHIVTIEEQEK